jgi:uncharacterized protein (TIGR03067 family)
MLLANLGLLFVGLGLVADSPTGEAAKKDLQMLQGDWVMESSERDGKPAAADVVKTFTRTVKDNRYTASWEDEEGAHSVSGMFTLDPTKTPKRVDVVLSDGPSKGKTMLGIYQLDGETQTLCVAAPGKDRPTAFNSRQGTLIVWKRAKK